MVEIALPTYNQVQSVINNQLNSMTYNSIEIPVLTDQTSNPDTLLTVEGSGILLFIAKSLSDDVKTHFRLNVDGASSDSSEMLVGGSFGSSVTLMVPFNTSLVVKGSREGTVNTTLGINYLLK